MPKEQVGLSASALQLDNSFLKTKYLYFNEIEDEELACDCVCPRSVEFVLSNLEIGETYNIVLSKNLNGKYFSFEVVFERDTDLMFIRS